MEKKKEIHYLSYSIGRGIVHRICRRRLLLAGVGCAPRLARQGWPRHRTTPGVARAGVAFLRGGAAREAGIHGGVFMAVQIEST
jgi:hypothetical protein